MRLMKDKEEIKPVQDESMMGLNLVKSNAQAHKTLSKIREASANTKIKPLFDAAEQGLNMVEYHANKEAQVMNDALKYHLENDEKNIRAFAEKEKQAVDYQVHKLQDAVEYQ